MTKKQRRLFFTVIVLMAVSPILYLFTQVGTFWVARKQIRQEWATVLPDNVRDPAVMRGILNYMRTSEGHFTFVPHSSWENAVCAGNIIGALNFIIGEDRLKHSSAWMFEKENSDYVTRIFHREEDFLVVDGAIIEDHDQGFYLNGILDMVGEGRDRDMGRIYIIGYHYQHTQADPAILDDRRRGGTLNSHLMLLLGTNDNRWYGYHLFHDPQNPTANPFSVIDLGECRRNERCMPQSFDLMYIWTVRGIRLPLEGAPVQLVQESASYSDVIDVVGDVIPYDHFRDTILTHRADLGDTFPRVITLDE